MGLACPVCDVPHTDVEHLADHLAVTAMVRRGDHAAWLDEHAPDWSAMTRADLGSVVGDYAAEVDSVDLHEEVDSHDHEHVRGQPPASGLDAGGDLDAEARAMLDEARRMTERMYAERDDADANQTD